MTEARATATREEGFVGYLNGLKEREDRAALAALRRGLGKEPGTEIDAYKHILRFNPPEREETWYCLVAALFALHPADWHIEGPGRPRVTNFGASLYRLWQQREAGRDGVERRLVALLNAHLDDLPDKLRHAVSLLRAEEIPVDWVQLIRDLRGWEADSRWVQRSWARAFWAGTSPAGEALGEPSPAVTANDELNNNSDGEET